MNRFSLDDATDPSAPRWQGLRLPVRLRVTAAIASLRATGTLRRADIERIGEVTERTAATDITEIRKRCPGLVRYDKNRKAYVLKASAK